MKLFQFLRLIITLKIIKSQRGLKTDLCHKPRSLRLDTKKSSRGHFKNGIPSPCPPVGLQDPRTGIIKSPTYKYSHRGKNKGDAERAILLLLKKSLKKKKAKRYKNNK